MPLGKQNKTFNLTVDSNNSEANKKRIFSSSLSRVIFIKEAGKGIVVRELNYVPNYDYLVKSNFDISKNSFYNLDEAFKGDITIKDWQDNFVKGYRFEKGKIRKTFARNKYQNRTFYITSTSHSNGCEYENTEEWEEKCTEVTLSMGGDEYVYTNCKDYYVGETGWVQVYCDPPTGDCEDPSLSYEECLCQQMGLSSCEQPEPNPDPVDPNDELEAEMAACSFVKDEGISLSQSFAPSSIDDISDDVVTKDPNNPLKGFVIVKWKVGSASSMIMYSWDVFSFEKLEAIYEPMCNCWLWTDNVTHQSTEDIKTGLNLSGGAAKFKGTTNFTHKYVPGTFIFSGGAQVKKLSIHIKTSIVIDCSGNGVQGSAPIEKLIEGSTKANIISYENKLN